MNFEELQRAEDVAMSQDLANAGFRHVAVGTWNRQRGDELNVIQLQEHSAKSSFSANLGIHYTFLPKAGTETPLDYTHVETPDCEIKLRLTEQDTIKDQWWPIAATSIEQVLHLVRSRGLPIFDSYRLDGPISAIDAQSIENINSGLLESITKVRACLLLARIHEHLGNTDKCIDIAMIGVKLAGVTVGPKKALKDILKRLGQPA